MATFPRELALDRRAYSLLTVKRLEADERVIEGIASTPTPDREGDVIEPLGASFSLPLPFLSQHDSHTPIGHVIKAKVSEAGIEIVAKVAKAEEPGLLHDTLELAWQQIKLGLVRGLSIGFRAIEVARIEGTYGFRFLKWDWLELSAVTVAANAEAEINVIKAIGEAQRQAEPHPLPLRAAAIRGGARGEAQSAGVTAFRNSRDPEDVMSKYAEQITAFEVKRAALAGQMSALMDKSIADGATLDQAQQDEYDGFAADIAAVDGHLKRFRELEALLAVKATPIAAPPAGPTRASAPGDIVVRAPEKLPPGVGFARLAKCKALARLDGRAPEVIAKALYGESSPIYGILIKAPVTAASTTVPAWAGALVAEEGGVFADFVEWLRPQTIIGRFGLGGVPALRLVPFRTALVGQTSGGNAYWVGEGRPKPLTKFDFERRTLEPLKVANIAVSTEELLRSSSPSAELILRDQLAAAVRERLDIDFIDPAKAAAAGISPGSILNGAPNIGASGTGTADDVRADVKALMGFFLGANNPPTSGVWIMPSSVAMSLGLMLNPLGQPEFPGVTMTGGTLMGLPVIASQYVPNGTGGSIVALVNASDIYEADEGEIAVDMSREASLEMSDAPTQNGIAGGGAQLVSLWQTNMVGFRAERIINWARRRDEAAAYLTDVEWGAA